MATACVGDSLMRRMQSDLCDTSLQFAQGGAVASAASCRVHRNPFARPASALISMWKLLRGGNTCKTLEAQLNRLPENVDKVAVSIGGNDLFRMQHDGLADVAQSIVSSVQTVGQSGAHAFILGLAGGTPPSTLRPFYRDMQQLDGFVRDMCGQSTLCTYVDISDVEWGSDDGVHFDEATASTVQERFRLYLQA